MALPAMTIDGDVVAVSSHWTSDGSRIETDATIRTPDGSEVIVSQLGGTVDGIGMITMPGPPVLVVGMKVAVAVHGDMDLSQREQIVLDSAKVLAYPPNYVRTGPTDRGNYLYWESGCVFVTVDSAGTAALPGDDEFAIIDTAIATWNDATNTASCSYLKVMDEGRKASEVSGKDKVNLIKFRDTSWCRPAVDGAAMKCYSSQAAGVTTATYVNDPTSSRDGAILDADIELNGKDFSIAVCQDPAHCMSLGNGPGGFADLQNTLTHELGHLHGLEHPCLAFMDLPRKDSKGNDVPSCDDLAGKAPAITEATMYNFQSPGEIKKRTLSQDDITGICEIYPTANDPGTCAHVGSSSSGGCCSASGRPDVSFLLAGSTALLLFRRRKTSPRT
jgi:hypothetical protein